MEVRALRESEREECIALWRTVWPGDNDVYFRRYFEGDVEWLPYYTQVALEDGRLVSAAHICRRTVACGDFRLTLGGIANVATLPEYRGRGLNTACLRAAIAVMEADAMDFSLLFTGIYGYYARLGFAALPRTRLRGALRVGEPSRTSRLTVRPARAGDLGSLFRIYDEYNATRPIAVQRSPAYWRDWIGLTERKLDQADPPLVAVDSQGRVVGYVIYHLNFYRGHQITEDYAYVSEYGEAGGVTSEPHHGEVNSSATFSAGAANGCRDSDGGIALALLEAVATRARASGKRELHLSIALDTDVRAAMAQVCESAAENVTESAMARLLHGENLLRSLLMEWNDRWAAAGRPSGEVSFQTPYKPVKVDATGRFLKVTPVEAAPDALSHSVLLGLLFATVLPEQAAREPAQLPLLSALFPPQDGVYWSADGF